MSQQNASNESTVAVLYATLFALVKTVVIGHTLDTETKKVTRWGSVKSRASHIITLGGTDSRCHNKADDTRICHWDAAYNAFIDSFEEIEHLFTCEEARKEKEGKISIWNTFRSIDPKGVGACIGLTKVDLDKHLETFGISPANVEIDNGRKEVDGKSALAGLRAKAGENASQRQFEITSQPPISSMQQD